MNFKTINAFIFILLILFSSLQLGFKKSCCCSNTSSIQNSNKNSCCSKNTNPEKNNCCNNKCNDKCNCNQLIELNTNAEFVNKVVIEETRKLMNIVYLQQFNFRFYTIHKENIINQCNTALIGNSPPLVCPLRI